MNEMIDISKLKTYSKPHKVYIPSKYGVFVNRADLEQLLDTPSNSEYITLKRHIFAERHRTFEEE